MSEPCADSLSSPVPLTGASRFQRTEIVEVQEECTETVITGDSTQIMVQEITDTIQSVNIVNSVNENDSTENVDSVDEKSVNTSDTQDKTITHAELRGCAVIAAIALFQEIDNDMFRCGLFVSALVALS